MRTTTAYICLYSADNHWNALQPETFVAVLENSDSFPAGSGKN